MIAKIWRWLRTLVRDDHTRYLPLKWMFNSMKVRVVKTKLPLQNQKFSSIRFVQDYGWRSLGENKATQIQLKLICGISLKKQWEQSAVTVTKHVVYAIFEVFPTRVYNVGAISLNFSQVSGWILIGYKSRQTGRTLVQVEFTDRSYDSPKKFDLNLPKRHSLKRHELRCNIERFQITASCVAKNHPAAGIQCKSVRSPTCKSRALSQLGHLI